MIESLGDIVGQKKRVEKMTVEPHWELWTQQSNTFGEGEKYLSARYADEGAANLACWYQNQGWGTYAWLEFNPGDPEISQDTVEDVRERYKGYTFYPKLTMKEVQMIAAGKNLFK